MEGQRNGGRLIYGDSRGRRGLVTSLSVQISKLFEGRALDRSGYGALQASIGTGGCKPNVSPEL
jgi:hypothetical protein